MEGCRVYDDSPMTNVLLKNERIPCTSPVLDSVWGPNSSSSFPGSVSMVNFEDVRGEHNTERPFFGQIDSKVENCDEGFDGCFHQPEKKRRLKLEQVQFLEKSFEVENKLEPDRKVKLAKELGLQPRQVAIWFQNRRARYKTKLLEKEYDSLKASYDKLKADYDTLCLDNDKLKSEVHLLSQKLLLRENGKPKPEPCDPISPMDHQPTNGKPKPEPCDPTSPMDHPPKNRVLSPNDKSNVVPVVSCKQEDASSSGRSDLLDSDSPHYTDGNHSAVLEPAHSSHVFEPDLSDFSQDEDDSLLRSSCFPKLEFECCDDLQPNSCDFGFPVQDQGTWFWQY